MRQRALEFVGEWRNETREQAEAKPFWVDFFAIFGIKRRRVAAFEYPVRKHTGKKGFIDLLWPGVILIEHKSGGEDLLKARVQAVEYLGTLPPAIQPRYLLLCDFDRFVLEDLDSDRPPVEFTLDQLPDRLGHFAFFMGEKTKSAEAQVPITIEAVALLDQLHNELDKTGYKGHDLEVFLVRTLYCLFAEDTGIFSDEQFSRLLKDHTQEDGSDTGPLLSRLFQVLNTAPKNRPQTLKPHLNFAYINGNLFAENIQIPDFDASMRQKLIKCASLDWSFISPAIFGALFQGIMGQKSRRQGGAHYTSEKNILKVIEPLFLDALWSEFEGCRSNLTKLRKFHKKLASLRFLDPACGCGNFLVVTYRELRVLELEVLQELNRSGQMLLDAAEAAKVNVDQFYGIEIDEFPVQIARVALWLTDHLENRKLERTFGTAYARIPLAASPCIVHGNALQLDWTNVLDPKECTAVMGNPPFVGKNYRTEQQDIDMAVVAGDLPKWRSIDYVASWHIKALDYIQGTGVPVGFVSTNSICQGEQVSALWPYLLDNGLKLNFAHRTFAWANEARGKAGVHCIILGFGRFEKKIKDLWSYSDPRGEPEQEPVNNISPYLLPGPNSIIWPRRHPINGAAEISYGSMMIDKGRHDGEEAGLLLTREHRDALLAECPDLAPFIRVIYGGDEFLNGTERWCLWLENSPLSLVLDCKLLRARIEGVKRFRESSDRPQTKELAKTPSLFGEIRQPNTPYLLIPKVSSENRRCLPIGFVSPEIIASGSALIIPGASLYDFGVLSSAIHDAWIRTVAGRLESRLQYSNSIVYNTFPWPDKPSDKLRKTVELAAQGVLDARALFPKDTLARLYNSLATPPALVRAHGILDRAVDLCYHPKPFANERKRAEFLFDLYEKLSDKPRHQKRREHKRQEAEIVTAGRRGNKGKPRNMHQASRRSATAPGTQAEKAPQTD
jgi:hypothetical protein